MRPTAKPCVEATYLEHHAGHVFAAPHLSVGMVGRGEHRGLYQCALTVRSTCRVCAIATRLKQLEALQRR